LGPRRGGASLGAQAHSGSPESPARPPESSPDGTRRRTPLFGLPPSIPVPPVPLSDPGAERALVEACKRADHEAQRELFVRYRGPLYRSARRRLATHEDAEEAVQETLLRAFRAMPRFDGEYRLTAWLFRILENVCHDIAAGTARRSLVVEALKDEVSEATPDGPGEHAERLGEAQRMATVLAAIPVPYREAVVLRDVEDLSYAEAAEVLEVSEGALRVRVHRGRKLLKSVLERVGKTGGLVLVPFGLLARLWRGLRTETSGEMVRAASNPLRDPAAQALGHAETTQVLQGSQELAAHAGSALQTAPLAASAATQATAVHAAAAQVAAVGQTAASQAAAVAQTVATQAAAVAQTVAPQAAGAGQAIQTVAQGTQAVLASAQTVMASAQVVAASAQGVAAQVAAAVPTAAPVVAQTLMERASAAAQGIVAAVAITAGAVGGVATAGGQPVGPAPVPAVVVTSSPTPVVSGTQIFSPMPSASGPVPVESAPVTPTPKPSGSPGTPQPTPSPSLAPSSQDTPEPGASGAYGGPDPEASPAPEPTATSPAQPDPDASP